MNRTLGRAGGIGVGLLIVAVGYALLDPGNARQTPAGLALASVIIALGIGAIGAAVMPDTLTINGSDVTPLKLSGTATGGAAFFIATLLFLYATGVNKPGGEPKPTDVPGAAPTLAVASPSPGAVLPSPQGAPPAARSTGTAETGAAPRAASAMPDTQPQGAQGPAVPPGWFRVRTYCSTCCPQGPQGCPNWGVGVAPTLQQAGDVAARYCIASGGHPDTCYGNVEQF